MSFRVFPKAKRISKTIVSFNLIKHKLISRFHFLRNSSPFRKYRFNRIYSDLLTHLIGWFRSSTKSRARQYLNAHKINLCQIYTRDITRYHSVIYQVSYKIFYWVRNSNQTKQLLILLLATATCNDEFISLELPYIVTFNRGRARLTFPSIKCSWKRDLSGI